MRDTLKLKEDDYYRDVRNIQSWTIIAKRKK